MSGQGRYSTLDGLVGEGSSEKVTGAKGRAASHVVGETVEIPGPVVLGRTWTFTLGEKELWERDRWSDYVSVRPFWLPHQGLTELGSQQDSRKI